VASIPLVRMAHVQRETCLPHRIGRVGCLEQGGVPSIILADYRSTVATVPAQPVVESHVGFLQDGWESSVAPCPNGPGTMNVQGWQNHGGWQRDEWLVATIRLLGHQTKVRNGGFKIGIPNASTLDGPVVRL